MAKRLRFLSINRIAWRSLCKAALIALALFLAVSTGFSFWSLALFAAALAAVYFRQVAEREMLRVSFWSITLLALAGFWTFAGRPEALIAEPWLFVLAFACFMGACFVLVALGDFLFKDRFLWYGIANTAALFAAFLVFPALVAGSLWWVLPFFAVIYLLFKEAFVFFGAPQGPRVRTAAAALALIGVETSFLLGLLPLGVLNAAAFLALLSFLLRDTLIARFAGTLDRTFVLRELTVFVLFALVIFASSTWTV